LNEQQLAEYSDLGFHVAKRLFSEPEIDRLRSHAKSDHDMDRNSYDRNDGQGNQIRLSLWNQPGDGIYGAFSRSRRIFEVASSILKDEPYHYHSKMIMKDAKVGGAWAWHQDYGYWYQNAVLKPQLMSAFIAVDRATKENGCLQVIEQSHLYGRIDHVLTGEQAGADIERVNEILKREKLTYLEMEPGDTVFFDANLLHRSAPNHSDFPRWSMICCYNSRSNSPFKESRHPPYSPIEIVGDQAILDFPLQPNTPSNEELPTPSTASGNMQWHRSTQTPSAKNLKTD
jgi:ectoine hydroxylase